MEKVYICPFCNDKKYSKKRSLANHILLRHKKYELIILSLSLTILGMVISLFAPQIGYTLDKYFGEENINAQVYYNIFYPIETKKMDLSEDTYSEIIKIQKDIGFIPCWADKDPLNYGIEDNGCAFFIYENAPTAYDNEVIIIAKDEGVLSPKQLSFEIPSQQFIDTLLNCKECFGYLFLIENSGKRDLNKLNLKACFKEDYEIIYSSEKVFQESKNCFRIEDNNLLEENNNVGYLIIRKDGNMGYEDFWEETFFMYSGSIQSISKSKEFNQSTKTKIITAYFPNLKC